MAAIEIVKICIQFSTERSQQYFNTSQPLNIFILKFKQPYWSYNSMKLEGGGAYFFHLKIPFSFGYLPVNSFSVMCCRSNQF